MFKALLLNAVKTALTAELVILLDEFEKNNGEQKALQLRLAIANSFELLQDVTKQTKTTLDDTFVQIVLDAVRTVK